MLYVSTKDLVAFTADGVHSHGMTADVPTELPDRMIPSLVALGARPYEGKPTVELDATRVTALVEASRKILAENTPEHLTRDGTVKVASLDAAVGFTPTKAEREAADATIEG